MDEETLVDGILAQAAQLVSGLRKRGISVSPPFCGFDSQTGRWVILMGISAEVSRRESYEAVQKVIKAIDLSISLDQIALLRDQDSQMAELREAANVSFFQGRTLPQPLEVGDMVITELRSIQDHRIQFEQIVEESLQLFFSGDAKILKGLEVFELFRPDLLVDFDSIRIIVEVTGLNNPVRADRIMVMLGKLWIAQQNHQPTKLLVVSGSGYPIGAFRKFQDYRDVELVEWNGRDGKGRHDFLRALTLLSESR